MGGGGRRRSESCLFSSASKFWGVPVGELRFLSFLRSYGLLWLRCGANCFADFCFLMRQHMRGEAADLSSGAFCRFLPLSQALHRPGEWRPVQRSIRAGSGDLQANTGSPCCPASPSPDLALATSDPAACDQHSSGTTSDPAPTTINTAAATSMATWQGKHRFVQCFH